MKTLLLLLLPCALHAQINFQMRAGISDKPVQFIVAPALTFTAKQFTLASEMIVESDRGQPADFGLKASYSFGNVEAGAGYYYRLYSTDPTIKDVPSQNTFTCMPFVAYHYKQWFFEYDRLPGENLFTIGVKMFQK